MTRGFSFLLPVTAVESMPSTGELWARTETPGSILTVTANGRMGDGCVESSTLSAELPSVVLLLLFIFIVFSSKSEESLIFWSDQG